MTAETEDVDYLRALIGGDGLHGPGDDCALVACGPEALVGMDPVVEGRHFEPGESPSRIGRKLVHRNFSDLAAMGAWPVAVAVSFVFGPGWPKRRRHVLYRSVAAAITACDAAWVGGDVAASGGASVFSCCVIGRACAERCITRSGLRPGDLLFVTGRLGRSLATGHHLDFEPRLSWGKRLATRHEPVAMIDVSDGLGLDLARLLAASGDVGAVLEADRVPLRRGATLAGAFGDGEDHELLFGLRPEGRAALGADAKLPPLARTPIGEVRDEPGIVVRDSAGCERRLETRGFRHELEE